MYFLIARAAIVLMKATPSLFPFLIILISFFSKSISLIFILANSVARTALDISTSIIAFSNEFLQDILSFSNSNCVNAVFSVF